MFNNKTMKYIGLGFYIGFGTYKLYNEFYKPYKLNLSITHAQKSSRKIVIKADGYISEGMGFLIRPDLLITSDHIVANLFYSNNKVKKLSIRTVTYDMKDNEDNKDNKNNKNNINNINNIDIDDNFENVIYRDQDHDLALIKLNKSYVDYIDPHKRPLSLNRIIRDIDYCIVYIFDLVLKKKTPPLLNTDYSTGTPAFVIKYANNENGMVISHGYMKDELYCIAITIGENVIQTKANVIESDTHTYPGFSGGALVNFDCCLMGVHCGTTSRGTAMAISINHLLELLKKFDS